MHMFGRYKMDNGKIIHSILFVLNKLGGESDLHKIFKILYFADQKHLAIYGFPITGDYYIAMPHGPVPSKSYDVLKAIRGDSFWTASKEYSDLFEVEDHIVIAKQIPDMDELAESDVECLLEAIAENKDLTFQQLVDKSHKSAWEKARNDASNFDNEMKVEDIAKEVNVNEEMLKYIMLNIENQILLKEHAEL